MWLTPAWASSPFSSSTLYLPSDSPANIMLSHAPHKNVYAHARPTCRGSSFRMLLLAQETAALSGKRDRLDTHADNAGTSAADTTDIAAPSSRRPSPSTPLTAAILVATFGSSNISRQRLRNLADSPAVRSQLESALSGGGARASRAQAKLRKLLEAVEEVIGRKGDDCASTAATAAKVVTGCPELLLLEGRNLQGVARQLRDMV